MLGFDLYPHFHGSHLALGGGDGHSECKSHGSQRKMMLKVLLFCISYLEEFCHVLSRLLYLRILLPILTSLAHF